MKTKTIIKKMMNCGLWTQETEEAFFSWRGCEYCQPGKGATVYEVKGYTTLKAAQKRPANYYLFNLCAECINKLYYGEF